MERKNRIVVFGGTGYIGKHLVKASLSLGHPIFVYTSPLTSKTPPSKTQLCKDFTSMGITLLQRFVPSGFGAEEDRIKPLPPFQALLEKKMKIRREIEAAGIL